MNYNFTTFKTRVSGVSEWLVQELSGIRTGKASPILLDGVQVESYGSRVPIKHIAAISMEDAKTLRVTPWDNSQVKAIESAIAQSNLGLSTAPDQIGLRVIFPDLTEERRKALRKVVGEKLEEARISLRKEREKVWTDIQAQEKAGELSEDDKFRLKDELQKMIDEGNKALEATVERKEKEIMG